MQTKLVSIVIPIYKVEKYLVECLDSCVNQTYKNLEIIAVNDGSPDGCGDIIEQYVAKDSRFVHLRQENQGLPAARSNGIAISNGDYIIHLDGDDFLSTDCVELLVDEIERSGADMVYSDAYYWTDGVKSEFIVNPENRSINSGMDYLEMGISTFIWGKIYTRQVSLNLIPQRTNVSEDMFFNLQMLPRCRKVSYLKGKFIYYYRQHSASIMNDKRSKIAVEYLEHAFQRRELFDHVELSERYKNQLLYDNIFMILRYMKYVGLDDKVNSLISLTYKEYKFRIPRSVKEFRMTGFFILARFCPRFTKRLL